jgi:SOS-response transcriptional repressor LexA
VDETDQDPIQKEDKVMPQHSGLMHLRILAYVQDYIHANGYAPTYDEIAAGVGLRSKCNVGYYLDRLVDEGALTRRAGSPRALALLQPQEPT